MNVIGVGTDIVECLRIAQMIERHGETFLTRIYTPHEIEHCSSRKAATQHYAARWAGKEAVLKAMGIGWSRGIHWHDIEVRSEASGGPRVALGGGAREMCEKLQIVDLQLSIAHCRTHASGFAIATGGQPASNDGETPF
ncbi:MAG TPA: holo-[acyl-carrier-protein] synthase [Planctomycetaceae bacterium]|nr:holo-[acyl-carrier-protein] synthase [Blastopirellula sp.]HAY80421.1 holo-[acyl-carrier-protein] synthase [Planctomycetaceae bacterium]|tara:strand:+ start:317 stop:733 length:417 start_codon:yes stop_codon:yes gene_type:complete